MKLVALLAGAVLLLTGCSSAPTESDLTERFAAITAETSGVDQDNAKVQELAAMLAAEAVENCNSSLHWSLKSTPGAAEEWPESLQYAWAKVCSDAYGPELLKTLQEQYGAVIAEQEF